MLTSQTATYRYLFGVTYIIKQLGQRLFEVRLYSATPGSADPEWIRSYYSNDQSKLYQGNWFSYLIIIFRYGIAIYLIPIFDEEDLKTQKLSSEARSLQTLKNNMIRVINGLRVVQCVNTKYAKTERKNQNDDSKPNGCVPHNSRNLQYNASSEQIKDTSK